MAMKQDLISDMSNLQVTDNPGNGQTHYVSRELPHKMGLSHPTNNTTMMKDTSNSVRSSSFSNLIKPSVPLFDQSLIPNDMKHVQALKDSYARKSYFADAVYKKQDNDWSKCYAELCGPVLALWEQQQPYCIDITNAQIEILGPLNEPGRENVFSIYTPDNDTVHLIDVPDHTTAKTWVCAIRLSCFEYTRIHRLFTYKFVSRFSDVLAKPSKKMEGYVQACFEGSTDWKKYWAVVSDRKQEKKLFGKKSIKTDGRIMFYETKKSKSPAFTMEHVTRAYILYPESPHAIDAVSTCKVEGNMVSSEQQGDYSTSVLIMAPSTKDLVKWTVGTFDAFKLYGRPTTLYNDALNTQSLTFGDMNVFLELSDVINSVDIQTEKISIIHSQFTNILVNKLKQPQPKPRQQRQGSMNQQKLGQRKLVYSNTSAQSSRSQISQNTNRYSPPKHQVYDSDEDSEDDVDVPDTSDEDESDDDPFILSSFRKSSTKKQANSSTSSDMDRKSTSTKGSTVSSSLQRTAASSHSSLSLHSQTSSSKIKSKPQLRTKVSLSDEENAYYSGSEDAGSFYNPQQWESASQYQEDYVGPMIPPLGNHFATQNSLLDTYRPSGPSAQDQEGYARATGQPLIQVAHKPGAPRAGLVGMISQIEKDKKKEARNRYNIPEQPRPQMMQQPMMMYPGMMPVPMMYPGMMSPHHMMQPQMMQMPNHGMMMMPMMDPRVSMMMMQPQYMRVSSSRVNLSIPEDEDEDDDVPLESFHTVNVRS